MASKKPAAKKKPANAVQKTKTTEVAKNGIDFLADANAGMEEADGDSFAIPFLTILQSNSPQVDEASGEALEGARAGMFFETVSQSLYSGKDGITIIPCSYKRTFIHWGGRDVGGGFKGEFTPAQASELVQKGKVKEFEGKLFFPLDDGSIHDKKSDILSDTRVHYVLVEDEDREELVPVVFSLSSTQIKKSKSLMSLLAQHKVADGSGAKRTAPMFANRIRITTIPESNDKGNWFGLQLISEGPVDDMQTYSAGKAFYEQVKSGAAQTRFEDAKEPATGDEDKAF